MTDFVLVHGAWHGAWSWKRVMPALWKAGHRAFAVTLTGVGERSHLMSRDIKLDTHIRDVMGVIEAEDMRGAVLVGHSYSGMVITGVADRIANEEAVGHLVYVDAVVPEPGESWSSGHTPDTRASRRKSISETGELPPPDPKIFGLEGDDHAWVQRHQTPQPGGVYDDPLSFDPDRVKRWPRTFVDCTNPALATIALMRERVRAQPGWNIVEIPTGHDPMISAPGAFTNLLLSLAQPTPP